jgi:hypothetical protein
MNMFSRGALGCLISIVCLGYDGLAAREPSANMPAFSPTVRQILVFPFKEQKTYIVNTDGSESDSKGFNYDQQQVRQREQLRAARENETGSDTDTGMMKR